MAEISDYLEEKLINHTLRNIEYVRAATIYVALFTSDPLDDGSGTEVSGGSYAREVIAFGDPGSTSGLTTTSVDITFTTATASWGNVSHVGIMDALTTGNLLFHSPLTSPKTVDDGDTFKINSGDITITLA